MDREIPQLLHVEVSFLGMSKEQFLAVFLSFGVFSVLFDASFSGMLIGISIAYVLGKWAEEKPRGIVYHQLRRYFPLESGILDTGIDPLDRRVVG